MINFNKNNVNIIDVNNHKTKSKNKKSKSKNNIKKNIKQNRINNIDNIDNEFPQGNKFKCIGPCYPANTLYYNPLTLQAIKSKSISCPIFPIKINNKIKIKDKCHINENYDLDNYDMFVDVVQLAQTYNSFLQDIYNIKNIYDVELFLDNNIMQLPSLSQKRLINSIYKVYRDNDNFPNKKFLSITKNLIKKKYDITIKSKKILSKIMENKFNEYWNDMFLALIK